MRLYSDYLLEGGCLYSSLQSQFDYSIMTSNCFSEVMYQNKEFKNYTIGTKLVYIREIYQQLRSIVS